MYNTCIIVCNTILEGWYCIGIATFSEIINTEYWTILENKTKWFAKERNLNLVITNVQDLHYCLQYNIGGLVLFQNLAILNTEQY